MKSLHFSKGALALVTAGMLAGMTFECLAQAPSSSPSTMPERPAPAPAPSGQAPGGQAAATSRAGAASLSAADKKFVEQAAMDGMAEVETGKLAESKGTSDSVKNFGKQMVQDHGKANSELQSIAQSKGLQVPTSPDASHQRDMQKLEKLSGADFDKRYAKTAGVKDHKAAVKLFSKQAKDGKDADLKAFAEKTLPVLQSHLKMAQDMDKSVK